MAQNRERNRRKIGNETGAKLGTKSAQNSHRQNDRIGKGRNTNDPSGCDGIPIRFDHCLCAADSRPSKSSKVPGVAETAGLKRRGKIRIVSLWL